MQKYCPFCGNAIVSEHANFCSECGQQIREIPSEDVGLIAPEEERHKPMPVQVQGVVVEAILYVDPDLFT